MGVRIILPRAVAGVHCVSDIIEKPSGLPQVFRGCFDVVMRVSTLNPLTHISVSYFCQMFRLLLLVTRRDGDEFRVSSGAVLYNIMTIGVILDIMGLIYCILMSM